MKNTNIKIILIVLFFVAANHSVFAGNKTIKIKTSAICDMCKNRIELVLNNLEGVKKSLLNISTKVVIVKFDNEITNEEVIKKAIVNAGYDANEMAANTEAYQVLPGCCKKGSKCDE